MKGIALEAPESCLPVWEVSLALRNYDTHPPGILAARSVDRCSPQKLGVSKAELLIDLNVSGEQDHVAHNLSVQVNQPRFGLGFLPLRQMLEWTVILDTLDDQGNYSVNGSENFSFFNHIEGFVWRRPVLPELSKAYAGAAQLLVADRTRYGPHPFVDQVNLLHIKLVVFATTSRVGEPPGPSLVVELPEGFHCEGAAAADPSSAASRLVPYFAARQHFSMLRDSSGEDGYWEFPNVAPRHCRYTLSESQTLYAGQRQLKRRVFGPPRSRSLLDSALPCSSSLHYSQSWVSRILQLRPELHGRHQHLEPLGSDARECHQHGLEHHVPGSRACLPYG